MSEKASRKHVYQRNSVKTEQARKTQNDKKHQEKMFLIFSFKWWSLILSFFIWMIEQKDIVTNIESGNRFLVKDFGFGFYLCFLPLIIHAFYCLGNSLLNESRAFHLGVTFILCFMLSVVTTAELKPAYPKSSLKNVAIESRNQLPYDQDTEILDWGFM